MTRGGGDNVEGFQRAAPKKETSAMRRWLDRLKRVGLADARDDLLVAAGFVYGVGYLVWAFHALRYNLGLLPALESQYFIAGLVPALVVVAVYKFTMCVERGLGWLRRRTGSAASGWGRWLRRAIKFSLVASLVLMVLSAVAKKAFPQFSEPVMQAGIAIFAICFLLLPDGSIEAYSSGRTRWIDRWADRFFQGYRKFMVRYLAVAIALLGIIFYAERVHPFLSQEVGGGRPRCASLDLTRSQLSAQTLAAMFSQIEPNPNAQVVRSIEVHVFFAGSDYLLVKPSVRPESDHTTYEIRRAAAQIVAWCK